MKSKKLLVIVIMVFFLVIGWAFALKAVTGIDDKKKQDELLSEADSFMSRELYVRAIPLYEEALSYDTSESKNFEIENKLMNAYLVHSDMDEYVDIVEKRVKNNTALEDDYINAANYYISRYDNDEALELLEKGMNNLDSDKLVALYEENRYLYDERVTKYIEVVPNLYNEIMVAYDGNKWGYINSRGTIVLPCEYDSATTFSDSNHAVVSKDGVFFTILKNGDRYGVDDGDGERINEALYSTGSNFQVKRGNVYEFVNSDLNTVLSDKMNFEKITRSSNGVLVGKKDNKWTIINLSDGSVVLDNIEDVAINSIGSVFYDSRAMVKTGGKWHLIGVDGKDVFENTFEGAKAPESSGYIAVQNEIGKWGFVDLTGNIVIDYQYNDAYSFSDDVAAVKLYNDSWVYISKKNEKISEKEYELALPFHNGVSQVYKDGVAGLLKFKFYSK